MPCHSGFAAVIPQRLVLPGKTGDLQLAEKMSLTLMQEK